MRRDAVRTGLRDRRCGPKEVVMKDGARYGVPSVEHWLAGPDRLMILTPRGTLHSLSYGDIASVELVRRGVVATKKRSFLVVLQEETGGAWSVTVPGLPGCRSQGDTLEEARRNVVEAIKAFLESARRDRRPLIGQGGVCIATVEVCA